MSPKTEQELLAINRRFYEERGEAFADSRRGPWPGFSRVLARIQAGAVLDVGCGEGRFGVALERVRPGTRYVGVDLSERLLCRAEERSDTPEGSRWLALDCAAEPEALPRGPFAGAVALGVLHHVPGEARRAALLRAMADRLQRGGILAVTLWRFRSVPRLARLELDWDGAVTDPTDLEPGDALLSFQGDASVPRYCHFADDAETERVAAAPELTLVDRYRADGREQELNEYLVWERSA